MAKAFAAGLQGWKIPGGSAAFIMIAARKHGAQCKLWAIVSGVLNGAVNVCFHSSKMYAHFQCVIYPLGENEKYV